MTVASEYLMENNDEAVRLDIKTDEKAVREQAAWLGIGPGARVLDVGCGSGRTTSILYDLIQPGGEIVGVDFSEERIAYAREHFGGRPGIDFVVKDFTKSLEDLGNFDFVWIKFVLEYFRKEAPAIIKSLAGCLAEDGCLCILDLDYNCLNHYPLPDGMDDIVKALVNYMEDNYNFDAFLGRKLYAYMFDCGYRDIQMHLVAHHLIYGQLASQDDFNWLKKVEMASHKAPELFEKYDGGYAKFVDDFKAFFRDPRRFTYTPMMICKGKKPC